MNDYAASGVGAQINPPSQPTIPEFPPDKSPDEIPSKPPPMEEPPDKRPPLVEPVVPDVNKGAVNSLSNLDARSYRRVGLEFSLYSFT